MGIALAPHGYAAIDTATRKRHEFAELVDNLRWRWIQLAPHEPRMPPHQYVDGRNLRPDEVPVARMLEFVIDHHPESYLAYFRGYKRYNRYLEIGDGWSYWRARIGGRSFPHRQRPDACEWVFYPEDPPPLPRSPRSQLPRGICSVCGRSVVVAKNGELRAHRAPHPGLPPCPGRLPRSAQERGSSRRARPT